MIGFEGTRLLLLGYALFLTGIPKFRPLIIETLKRFIPYAVVTAGFLYWRVFIFEGARNATDVSKLAGGYFGNLRYMSIRLFLETIKDFLDTTIFAWFVQPYRVLLRCTLCKPDTRCVDRRSCDRIGLALYILFQKMVGSRF